MLVHQVVPGVYLTKEECMHLGFVVSFLHQGCRCPVGWLDVNLTALADARPLHKI